MTIQTRSASLASLALVLVCGVGMAGTIGVPADYGTIQEAIDASSPGDTIIVGPGTYGECIDYSGKAITVRSTDPSDPAVVASTVINGGATGSVVAFSSGEGPGSVLEGLTVTNGSGTPNAYGGFDGGGIYCSGASPTIRNNVITGNAAAGTLAYGGGIVLKSGSAATIEGNSIVGNTCSGFQPAGGGLACVGSSPTVTDNTISSNSAGDFGGGLYAGGGGTFSGNTISGNSAGSWGGGVLLAGTATLSDNTISHNSASTRGAGVYIHMTPQATVVGNRIEGNTGASQGGGICSYQNSALTVIRNNTILGNSSRSGGWGGGGIHAYSSYATIENNTIAGNSAAGALIGGAGILCSGGSAQIRNNIIVGNHGGGGIRNYQASPTVTYSNVFGNLDANYAGMTDQTGSNGNISADPLFAGGNDYHLQSEGGRWTAGGWVTDGVTSPCVDAGDPASSVGEEPAPNGGVLNMGAYGGTEQASKTYVPPMPVLARLVPDWALVGSPALTLTVNGSDFVAGSVVRWGGADRATTYVSDTQLTAAIPASDLATAGEVAVTVSNPAGESNALPFDVKSDPTVVWVDDDWAGTTVGTEVEPGWIFGYNAFDSMVTATAAVSPNGTVHVAAGTYVGYLVVDKPVTYLGANAGVHPAVGKHPSATVGTRGPESILTNSYYALKPQADDITVDGFLFTGTAGRIVDTYADADNFHLTNCIFDNSSTATTQGIVQFGGGSHVNMLLDFNLFQDQGQHTIYLGGGPYTGLTVRHNNFTGTGNGIFQASQPISGFSLTENTFTGGETGINMGKLDNPTITGNEFEAMSFCGVQVGTQGGTISGNDFHDFTGYVSGPTTYGFGVDLFGGQWGTWTCDGLQVTGNTFTNSPQGISIRGGVDGANVTGNTITDCGTGIWGRASGGIAALGANTVAGNDILGSGACGVLLDGVTGPDWDLGGTEIAAGIAEFIRLTSCPINVDAMGVTFGGAANGAEIEAKVWHRYDDPALGLVSYPDSRTDTAIAVTNAAGKRGQTVQLQAKLTAGGANLAGMSLAFWLDGTELGGAVTDAAGIARLTYTIDAAATVGGHDLLALFGGDATYKPALGEGTLTVEPATATGISLTLDVNPVDAGGLVTATVMGDNGVDYTAVAGYAIQPGAGGSWAGNVYTSSKAGTWTVQATYGPLGDTAELEVTSGAVASVAISPADATIAVGDTLTYTVEASDAQGNTWTPTVAAAAWTANGTLTGTFDDANTFTATGAGTGTVSCEVDGIVGNAAALTVNAAGGAGLILAWDKDDQNFYLCGNPADPQSAGAAGLISGAANGTFLVGGVTVIVTGSTNNRTVTVYNDAGIQNTLQVRWYVRSGKVSQAYLYSTIAGVTKTATFSSVRTFVDGQYKTGFWGLTHTLDAVNPTSITYGSTEQ